MEYQVGNRGIVLDACKPNESIYIFGCKDSVIQVQGMLWSIFVDSLHIYLRHVWMIGVPL